MEELIRELYKIVEQLEKRTGRPFTPDGHMIGSLGEVYAECNYELTLYPPSFEKHDAWTPDNKQVQIKTTQGTRIALSSEPAYLLALKVDRNGLFTEIYNGSGSEPWNKSGKPQKTSQRSISLKRLGELNVDVCDSERIKRRAGGANEYKQNEEPIV